MLGTDCYCLGFAVTQCGKGHLSGLKQETYIETVSALSLALPKVQQSVSQLIFIVTDDKGVKIGKKRRRNGHHRWYDST